VEKLSLSSFDDWLSAIFSTQQAICSTSAGDIPQTGLVHSTPAQALTYTNTSWKVQVNADQLAVFSLWRVTGTKFLHGQMQTRQNSSFFIRWLREMGRHHVIHLIQHSDISILRHKRSNSCIFSMTLSPFIQNRTVTNHLMQTQPCTSQIKIYACVQCNTLNCTNITKSNNTN